MTASMKGSVGYQILMISFNRWVTDVYFNYLSRKKCNQLLMPKEGPCFFSFTAFRLSEHMLKAVQFILRTVNLEKRTMSVLPLTHCDWQLLNTVCSLKALLFFKSWFSCVETPRSLSWCSSCASLSFQRREITFPLALCWLPLKRKGS